VLSAKLAVAINSSIGRHLGRIEVMVKFSGFIPGQPVHAHYCTS
jgi:hypothetical protein